MGEEAEEESLMPQSNVHFDDIGLSNTLLSKLKDIIGLKKPTPVQAACIDPIRKGCNVLAKSPTGTGKTMAFAIPIVEKWSQDPYGIFALIITPTRELALQIKDQFELLGGENARVLDVIGGTDMQKQTLELNKRPHFVIATPGRFADHVKCGAAAMKSLCRNLKYLVYDEADRMLDGQFEKEINSINTIFPTKKQTLLFTAIMSEKLRNYAENMDNHFIYEDKPKTDEVIDSKRVTQNYIICPSDFKDGYLIELLRSIRDGETHEGARSMIIFVATCRECQIISILLSELGFPNASLHSQMSQKARTASLVRFRSSLVQTLIATDLASRGLDIPDVDLVINFCVPWEADYVHRIGRAGRRGKKGSSVTIITTRDIPFLLNVEKYIGEKLIEFKINEEKVLKILTEVSVTKRAADLQVAEADIKDTKLRNVSYGKRARDRKKDKDSKKRKKEAKP